MVLLYYYIQYGIIIDIEGVIRYAEGIYKV